MSGNPAARGRRALRADNAALRSELAAQAEELGALAAQLNVLRGEQHEWQARAADAERATAIAAAQADERITAQVESWRKYAQAILRTTNGLQQWTEWYASALQIRDEELRAALETVAQLRSQLERMWSERVEQPAAPTDVETSGQVEAALREQIADLRTRLDHAAELVDHVVRRLVSPSSPTPGEPNRSRLELPLVREAFSDLGTPLDLVEEYPLLKSRPTG